ncbi:MAG: glycosyltransferase family 4 protein [Sphingomonadales bacterium]
MSLPRILYWAEMFWPNIGGIESFGAAVLPRLAERGYQIDVLSGDYDGSEPAFEVMRGIRIHRLPLRAAIAANDPETLLRTIGQVRRLKKEIAADVIHLNFSGPMVYYHLRTADAHPARLFTHFHGTMDRVRASGSILKELLVRSDWFVANSRMVRDDFLLATPEIADRTSIIYCGVEPPPSPAAMDTESPPVLLFVGRLIRDKGVDLAIEAFHKLLSRHPEARLLIAGEGDERPGLEALAASLGLTDTVEFLGWVRAVDVPALMARATLLLMPSRWREPFGLVAVEAALQCRPVIGTTDGGLEEIIIDGVTGRLVPRNDADAVAEAADALLSDREALVGMGIRAREHAMRSFSLDASAEALDAAYRRLAGDA